MQVDYAGIGDRLPSPETPDDSTIEAYGALAFLALRSATHRQMTVEALRLRLQPPLDWGLYHIFRDSGGVPRAALTWAWLGEAAEDLLLHGQPLRPRDWRSGDSFWVIDLWAPYGQGSGAAALHWLRHSLPPTIPQVTCLSPGGRGNRPPRRITCLRQPGGGWSLRQAPLPPLRRQRAQRQLH